MAGVISIILHQMYHSNSYKGGGYRKKVFVKKGADPPSEGDPGPYHHESAADTISENYEPSTGGRGYSHHPH